MAAVSLSPRPLTISTMSTQRRVPLSNNPNAVNSPFRAVAAAAAASKQKRSYATIQREEAYGQQPPTKKQMLEVHHVLRTPPRQQANQSVEGRVFTRKSNAPQTAFEKKLAAASQRPQQAVTRVEKTQEEQLQEIRNWQRHHRKVFPQYVFYFESMSEESRLRYTKQVVTLGAREAKFFSNEVTHVVTSRAIPPEGRSADTTSSAQDDSQSQGIHPQTINPVLLDRSPESADTQSDALGTRGKFTFDVPIGRRPIPQQQNADVRKQQGRNADVLHRARELGMKIWSVEKLHRMMSTMFDTDTQLMHGHNTRSNAVHGLTAVPRATREADLSQLLRNERINGPSDRDPTVAPKEMNMFKGPFIYIHDIDEKQKPIMVREYPKVAHKEDGDWPQFRSVANGKCPFVEEVEYTRRDAEKESARQKQQLRQRAIPPRTRSAATAAVMQPPQAVNDQKILADCENISNRNATSATSRQNKTFEGIHPQTAQMGSASSSRGPQNAFVSRASVGRCLGGEPVASGLQASNITSAIRSQMISSTSAQPGAKAGTSKEVHGLQRKVLEKNSGGPGSYGMMSSHRMTDASAAANEQTARPSRRRVQEHPILIEVDQNPSEAEEQARKAEAVRKAKAVQKRRAEKRDPKPGYCENCQDKFDDFDEHVVSRKHRKFAEKLENWAELDHLLKQLTRPLKPQMSSDF